jgi:hypothetical protein
MRPSALGNQLIPRHIYQCVADKRRLAEPYAENIARLRGANPGYTHELFDDADILQFIRDELGPHHVDRFRRINDGYGAAKADFFRYLMIYKHGGIYLDIKSTADRPFDDLLSPDDQYILCQWLNDDPTHPCYKWGRFRDLRVPGGEYQQWHVMAVPGHPYLAAVITRMLMEMDNYAPWRQGYGHAGVVRTTGPVMYTRAIHPILNDYPHRLEHDERTIGLRYTIFARVHDHRAVDRESAAHYIANPLPVLRMEHHQARRARAYIAAHRAAREGVVLPFKQTVRGMLALFKEFETAPMLQKYRG